MGALAAISAISAIAGTGISLVGQREQAVARERAARQRLRQEEFSNAVRGEKQARMFGETLASQIAREGASGFTLASPSFQAINRDSFNQYAQDEQADNMSLDFAKQSAADADRSARSQEAFGMGSTILSGVSTLSNSAFFKSGGATSGVAQTQTKVDLGKNLTPHLTPDSVLKRFNEGTTTDFVL